MIEAKVICDSISKDSPRLTTFQLRYPKWIHQEFLTHRMFSRNASSSRAIPVEKNLREVDSKELRVTPSVFTSEQRGMSGGSELSKDAIARAHEIWSHAASDASYHAKRLSSAGVHKSIVNRLIEPFLHINVVCSAVERAYLNFLGLRLDKAAQPEIRILAETMWREWSESKIQKLDSGQWHLPFCSDEDLFNGTPWRDLTLENLRKVSAARCARVSYLSFETNKRSTIEEDLNLFERLAGSSPMHLSPLEHQATPDELVDDGQELYWRHGHEHGNLHGWRQYRKIIPNEAVAPLPGSYSYSC
jgi:thymidylate synthase ThyX